MGMGNVNVGKRVLSVGPAHSMYALCAWLDGHPVGYIDLL